MYFWVYKYWSLCVFCRISALRPTSRSSCKPSRAPYSSASIIRFTWYVMPVRQPTEIAPIPAEATNETGFKPPSLIAPTVSLFCLQKREKRKAEEQRRKEWVDQEREKTLSRLRSFREVRLFYCLCFISPCYLSSVSWTPEALASFISSP